MTDTNTSSAVEQCSMTVNDTILSQLREQLVPSESLEYVSRRFQLELKKRLEKSEESMIVGGWVPQKCVIKTDEQFPNFFLAIDFGGSSLKFALISMPSCQIVFQDGFDITIRFVDHKFFDTIIAWISFKLNEYLAGEVYMPKFLVSITFSFPLNDNLEIITMGKGFEMSLDILHKSVKDLIASSFDRVLSQLPLKRFEVELCDVINDSIAVYLTSKFMCKNESISLILGTGINSCFELYPGNIPAKKRPHRVPSNSNCLVNVEAGSLGNDLVNLTKFDYHGDSERNMPLEDITSGKWLPMMFTKVLKQYGISDFDFNCIDGELLIEIVEGRYKSRLNNETSGLVQEIAKLIIQRGAFYVVAMLLAVGSLINEDISNNKGSIEVGYVGSFLANSKYYQSQIDLFSQSQMRLQFLHDSNLIGAAVATYLNRCN